MGKKMPFPKVVRGYRIIGSVFTSCPSELKNLACIALVTEKIIKLNNILPRKLRYEICVTL